MKINLIPLFGIGLISSLFILSSCADIPSNVISRTEERQALISAAQNESAGDNEIKTIPIGDLKKDADEALRASYSNIKIDKEIPVSFPDRIFICDFRQADDYIPKYETVSKAILREPDVSLITPVESVENGVRTVLYRDEEKQLHFCLSDAGFLTFIKPDAFSAPYGEGDLVKIYHIDRGDDLSDTYILNGRSVSVREAVDHTQDWLDKIYAPFEPDYQFKIKTAFARRNEAGDNCFRFWAEAFYKDIAIDSLVSVLDTSEPGSYYFRYYIKGLTLSMNSSDEISSFTNGVGVSIPENIREVKSIIPLSYALKLIEKTFADLANPLEFCDIGLKLTMSPDYDPNKGQYPNSPGVLSKGKLKWEFIIDLNERLAQQENSSEIPSTRGDIRAYVYVDAETGEIDHEFDLNTLWQ